MENGRRSVEYPGYEHPVQYYETDQMGCVPVSYTHLTLPTKA